MNNKLGDTLYKFRPFTAAGLQILTHRQIYFAAPETLNDPLDCQHSLNAQLQFSIDREENSYLKNLMLNLQGRNVVNALDGTSEDLHGSFEKIIRTAGVFSVSANAKDPLLWSHYGDAHSGLCFGFDRAYFEGMLVEPEKYNLLGGADVDYQTTPPFVEIFKEESIKLKDLLLHINDVAEAQRIISDHHHAYTSRIIGACLSTKSIAWAYEKEYRLVRGHPGTISFQPKAIREVVFGCKASLKDIKVVKTIMNKTEWSHVSFKHAQYDPLSFDLDLVEV